MIAACPENQERKLSFILTVASQCFLLLVLFCAKHCVGRVGEIKTPPKVHLMELLLPHSPLLCTGIREHHNIIMIIHSPVSLYEALHSLRKGAALLPCLPTWTGSLGISTVRFSGGLWNHQPNSFQAVWKVTVLLGFPLDPLAVTNVERCWELRPNAKKSVLLIFIC